MDEDEPTTMSNLVSVTARRTQVVVTAGTVELRMSPDQAEGLAEILVHCATLVRLGDWSDE